MEALEEVAQLKGRRSLCVPAKIIFCFFWVKKLHFVSSENTELKLQLSSILFFNDVSGFIMTIIMLLDRMFPLEVTVELL